MNSVSIELNENRKIYRELFLKAHESLKQQINALKCPSFCKKCKLCEKIRYSELSPSEIFEIAQDGDSLAKEYSEFFYPYGATDNFDYENNNEIDIALNHRLAKEVNIRYVDLVKEKTEKPVYFYYLKNSEKQSRLISNFPHSVTMILPEECGYREWQQLAIRKLQGDISKDIFYKLQEIKAYRHEFTCARTGTCCRLACSEFSYEQLKEKASKGDNFATQFISIFIPYESFEEAKAVFPDFIDYVTSILGPDEKVYFYHCPHLTEENLCSRYEQRPQICRDFPDNPLAILPSICGFYQWKEEVHVASLLLHALIQITGFMVEKIERTV